MEPAHLDEAWLWAAVWLIISDGLYGALVANEATSAANYPCFPGVRVSLSVQSTVTPGIWPPLGEFAQVTSTLTSHGLELFLGGRTLFTSWANLFMEHPLR